MFRKFQHAEVVCQLANFERELNSKMEGIQTTGYPYYVKKGLGVFELCNEFKAFLSMIKGYNINKDIYDMVGHAIYMFNDALIRTNLLLYNRTVDDNELISFDSTCKLTIKSQCAIIAKDFDWMKNVIGKKETDKTITDSDKEALIGFLINKKEEIDHIINDIKNTI